MPRLLSKASRRAHKASHKPRSARPQLAIEALEERRLLATFLGIPTREFPNSQPPTWVGPVVPNDPSFGLQWDLDNGGPAVPDADIDAPEAWGWETGSTRTTIAVVDTGVDYTHPDLARNIWINPGEIPGHIRTHLTDIDQDGRITFWDLNNPINQGLHKANDVNGNGFIDGGDLIAREYNVTPSYKPNQDPNGPLTATYIGGMSDGLDNDGNGYRDDLIGWDFKGDDNNPFDTDGHGTHVAGTIGAVGDNALGVSGINWRTQIMPLRIRMAGTPSLNDVLSDPSKYLRIMQEGQTQAIRAIRYAVANGARVSNHSWGAEMSDLQAMFEDLGSDLGLYEGFDDLKHAISNAREGGHIVVMAAGNAHRNIDLHPSYPAGFGNANMITVAATDANDQLAGFSNYGDENVDLAAPGTGIYSTVPGGYDYKDGTSMAAPHVTGVVGLVWSQHPSWTYQQVIAQIEGTTEPLAALLGRVKTGGRLSAFRAVTPGPWIPTPENQSFHELDRPVSTVGVIFNEAINPTTLTAADVVVAYQVHPNSPSPLTTSTLPVLVPLTVTGVEAVPGTGNRQFWISFAGRGPGTYQFSIGPDIKSQTGYLMDLDRDGVEGEANDDKHRFTVKMTMDYLKEQGPLADLERLRDFVQSISIIPKDVLMAKVRTTMVSQVVIHYSLPMDKVAGKLANYRLALPGLDGVLGTSDDVSLKLKSAKYNVKTWTVTLTPKIPLAHDQFFRLSVLSSGLVERGRRQLDGDEDGLAGGDYVLDMARGRNLKFVDQHANRVDLAFSGPGAMELFLRPGGQAEQLRLVNTVAGQSTLAATVQAASAANPVPVEFGVISAPTAFVNQLPPAIRVAAPEESAATDELFAKGLIFGKLGWKF